MGGVPLVLTQYEAKNEKISKEQREEIMFKKASEHGLQNIQVSNPAMDKRQDERFFKQLKVQIVSQGKISWGVVNDISQTGLFIKTNYTFPEGSLIDIKLMLPNSKTCFLRGIVRRSIETNESIRKFAIGVELLLKDSLFDDLLLTFSEQSPIS